ncbi:MFS transporter (macronuclear) [Tetrahymena thermophila SB210]|uniref:MFS transporter n=1 Tax=Tetrahymena thermophila (strain SB210) TaxID=312017 RepID=I7M2L6_TETTS|nr:MFS transporter [Tetrahymena thermophila SB210]EAS00768.2 MFS transporter [Tetrahymena thermophila SB210]|eukprot:XP_001021013.2 MFS transporter [Tetrahymena thermophila SB210]
MESFKQKVKVFFSKVKRPGLFQEQIKLFFNMFFAYATLHQIRSGWSFASKNMQDDTGLSNQDVGVINMIFLLFLGIGFEINGQIGDKRSPKHFITLGMIGSASAILLLCFSRIAGSSSVVLYSFFQALNGFFESMCFPCLLRLLGVWFSQKNRGLIVSLWTGGKNFGDIMGSILGDILMFRMGISWYGALIIYSILCLISMGVIYAKAENNPGVKGYSINKRINQEKIVDANQNKDEIIDQRAENVKQEIQIQQNKQKSQDINIEQSNKSQIEQQNYSKEKDQIAQLEAVYGEDNNNEQISNAQDNIQPQEQGDEKLKTLTIKQALMIPGVPFFILGFMCLKSLNYGLIFWLPKYLQDNGLEEYSASIFVIWSIGVFCGGITGGILGDKLQKRSFLMPPSLLFLLLFLFCFSQIPLNESYAALFMIFGFLMGALQGIPYNIISGPLMIDLGKHPKLKGKAQAVGTIAGLIEGSGSLCAALIQLVIPSIGEKNIFILFMLSTFASLISLLPVALNDYLAFLKEQRKQQKLKQQQQEQEQQQKEQQQGKEFIYGQQNFANDVENKGQQSDLKDSQDSGQIFKASQKGDIKSINLHEEQKNPSLQLNLLNNQYENNQVNDVINGKAQQKAPLNIEMNLFDDDKIQKGNNNNFHNFENNIQQNGKPFISPSSIQNADFENEKDLFNQQEQVSHLNQIALKIQQDQQFQKADFFQQQNDQLPKQNEVQILDLDDGDSSIN